MTITSEPNPSVQVIRWHWYSHKHLTIIWNFKLWSTELSKLSIRCASRFFCIMVLWYYGYIWRVNILVNKIFRNRNEERLQRMLLFYSELTIVTAKEQKQLFIGNLSLIWKTGWLSLSSLLEITLNCIAVCIILKVNRLLINLLLFLLLFDSK